MSLKCPPETPELGRGMHTLASQHGHGPEASGALTQQPRYLSTILILINDGVFISSYLLVFKTDHGYFNS